MNDPIIARVVDALRPVDGLAAIVLGGSRARGAAGVSSDYDFGLYYDPATPFSVADLQAALDPIIDDPSASKVTARGEWGPWINGGGWLLVDGRKVDLLYRDLQQVAAVIEEGRAGRVSMHYQPGHPHGFCSAIWIGEIAICRPLIDPVSAVANLKEKAAPYPDPLADALIARFHWEVAFSIDNAESALRRDDQTQIAGLAYRALCCAAQTLFARNRRYLINEKGAIAELASLPLTIPNVDERVDALWSAIGRRDFRTAIASLRNIAASVDQCVR